MKINFSTGNIAFEEYGYYEHIKHILDGIAEKIRLGYDHGPIMDMNGNKVGEWSL